MNGPAFLIEWDGAFALALALVLAGVVPAAAKAAAGVVARLALVGEDIARVVAAWTGIPVSRMLEGEREKLIKMEERLEKRVVGQKEAIEAVAAHTAPLLGVRLVQIDADRQVKRMVAGPLEVVRELARKA